MTQPDNCPLEVYTIMRDCWQHDPESRPHFQQLAEHLGKILEKNVTKVGNVNVFKLVGLTC